MSAENDIEIYRQRYETFRHLDRMRFQLLQILVAVGAAAALFSRFRTTPAEWWAFALIGLMLLLIGNAMSKVSNGLWRNNEVLHDIAVKIGDNDIPKSVSKKKSTSYRISLFVDMLGGLSLLIGLIGASRLIF